MNARKRYSCPIRLCNAEKVRKPSPHPSTTSEEGQLGAVLHRHHGRWRHWIWRIGYLPIISFLVIWLYFVFVGRLLNVSCSTKNLKLNFNWLYLEKNGLFFRISEILACYKLLLAFTRVFYLPYLCVVWLLFGDLQVTGHLCEKLQMVNVLPSLWNSTILVRN